MKFKLQKKFVALSTTLIAFALFTTACFNTADKQAGSTLESAPTPEGWRRVKSMAGSVTFAIPTDWKMDSWGTYYKNTQGLEDAYRLPENSGHDSIADIASTSIFVSSSDAQGKTVDQLWEQDDDINDLNSTIVIAGERARISECGGLLYEECVYVVKGGVAYVINVRNVSVVKETADASARLLSQEIRQILHTMNFSR